jgi:hypothetical protein
LSSSITPTPRRSRQFADATVSCDTQIASRSPRSARVELNRVSYATCTFRQPARRAHLEMFAREMEQ